MKKRFLIPAILIGTPLAIGITDAAVHGIGCATGHQGACAELTRRQAYNTPEEVARRKKAADDKHAEWMKEHKEWKNEFAAKEAKTKAFLKTQPAYRIKAAGGQQQLIRGCEAILKPSLKDPNSYRYLGGQVVVTSQTDMEVRLNYTATNSFGGRIQGDYICTHKA